LKQFTTLACVTLACSSAILGTPAVAQENVLMAAAARIDITPAVADLPAPLTSVHDPLYVRALVVDSAGKRAVVVVIDTPAIAADVYSDMLEKISADFAVPQSQILLSTTHSHNSMRVAEPGPSPIPTSEVFTQNVREGTMEAIRTAVAGLVPAKAGYAAGRSSLVSGRDEWHASQHRYIDGVDRSGTEAVDETMGVYKFTDLDGKPIAAVLNYGIEPVIYEQVNTEVSGDVPGAVSGYIEEMIGNDMVALFTIGAPATPTYRLWPEDMATPRGSQVGRILDAYGVMLGEEAIARMATIEGSATPIAISATQDSFICPGKVTTPRNLRTHCAYTEGSELPACDYTDEAFKDVKLSLGLLRLGEVTYLAADANIVPELWNKVKAASPFTHTQFVGANFGPFRFAVDDRAYTLRTYPATDTRAAPMCAEQGVLQSFAKMAAAVE
jgi:neutral ceramidase